MHKLGERIEQWEREVRDYEKMHKALDERHLVVELLFVPLPYNGPKRLIQERPSKKNVPLDNSWKQQVWVLPICLDNWKWSDIEAAKNVKEKYDRDLTERVRVVAYDCEGVVVLGAGLGMPFPRSQNLLSKLK
eukprot:6071579-Amphidinium_carterae.2